MKIILFLIQVLKLTVCLNEGLTVTVQSDGYELSKIEI